MLSFSSSVVASVDDRSFQYNQQELDLKFNLTLFGNLFNGL